MPLIDDSAERARLRAIVREVALAVESAPDTSTRCQRAILRAYLAADDTLVDDDGAATAHVSAALAARSAGDPLALYGGLAEIGWTIAHLADDAHAAQICASIDDTLLRALRDGRGNYDLVNGLVGFGVYALERGEHGHRLVSRVLDWLEATAEARGAGLAWHTPAAHLPSWQRAMAPDGYWNLGLAHGIAGIIALCARCVAADIDAARARDLMRGAASYMLDVEPAAAEGRFASWHSRGGGTEGVRARLAWCYGDLGIAAALTAAARVDVRWREAAHDLARSCAMRTAPPGVHDAALCHGTAGIAHIFARIAGAAEDAVLATAARRWLSVTLELRTDHAYGGFPAFDGGTRGWRADASLVAGATGVALALHAMVSEVEPLWDRTLLLDL
ncbi:MAG TPA: lanthionine synthetase LanC family protein [Kofleriaceae bacterium]|nr:lanthionine synthetase LanC family protein [Kofleriaceae bacterium]